MPFYVVKLIRIRLEHLPGVYEQVSQGIHLYYLCALPLTHIAIKYCTELNVGWKHPIV